MDKDNRSLEYVGNIAIDLYQTVTAEYPDVNSCSVEWLDHVGDVLVMRIYKKHG